MVMQLTGAIVNIILDPIMIFGLLGCPAMGISGAAIATVIGQFCGLGVGIVCNQLKNRELRLSLHGFRIHPRAVKDILAVGFPSMIMQSISSVLTVLMNMILIAYGNVAVSVLGVYFKLQFLRVHAGIRAEQRPWWPLWATTLAPAAPAGV